MSELTLSSGIALIIEESRDSNAIPSQRLVQAGLSPEISNSVYDLSGHSVELQFNAVLTEQLLLNLGYAFRSGDIVSTNMTSLAPQACRHY